MPQITYAQLAELPDLDLIELVRAGDEHAYAQLWSRHSSAALTAARNISFAHDPEDLVQESFAAILLALRNGNGPTQGFRPYMYATIRSVSQNWSNRSTPTNDIDDHADSLYELGDLSEDSANRSLTVSAFAALPDEWRTVLWYTEVEGMTPAEIAPLLGMTPKSVAALSFRARNGLRQSWLAAHTAAPSPDAGTECAWATKQFAPYLRDSLSARRTTRLQDHLVSCYTCSAAFAELTEVNRALRGILLPIFLGVSAATLSKAGLLGLGTAAPALVGSAAASGAGPWVSQNKPAVIGASVGVSAIVAVAIVAALTLQSAPLVAAPSQAPSVSAGPLSTSPTTPLADPPTAQGVVPPAPPTVVPVLPVAPLLPVAPTPSPTISANPLEPVAPQPTATQRPVPSPAVSPEPTPTSTPTPTPTPTVEPTTEPTVGPTAEPTTQPTAKPTAEPTAKPTAEPTTEPTTEPTEPVAEITPLVVNPTKIDTVLLPLLSGTGEPGATIEVLSAGDVVASSTVGDKGDRAITLENVMLPAGQKSLTFAARQITQTAEDTATTSAAVDIVQVNGNKEFVFETPSWGPVTLNGTKAITNGQDLTHSLKGGNGSNTVQMILNGDHSSHKYMQVVVNGVWTGNNHATGNNLARTRTPKWNTQSSGREAFGLRYGEGDPDTGGRVGPMVEFRFNLIIK